MVSSISSYSSKLLQSSTCYVGALGAYPNPNPNLEVGDRIVEIDGRMVRSNSDFRVNKGKKRRFKVVKANVHM